VGLGAGMLSPAQFRLWYPALEGVDSDDELTEIIAGAMALIALYLGYPEASDGSRSLGLKTYTFHLSGPAARQPLALCLCVRPIGSVVSLSVDPLWAYGPATELVENTDFVVDADAGIILLLTTGARTSWPTAYRAIRVEVTAGYATLPAWLVPLVVATVRHLWDRRNVQGETSYGVGGDSASLTDADALIPKAVRDLLDPLRVCA
jgi:hypothetical protein